MDNKFNAYFDDRYEEFSDPPGGVRGWSIRSPYERPWPYQRTLAKIIDRETKESQKEWRSDAKMFLAINIMENVIYPHFFVEDDPFSRSEMTKIIRYDVRLIVKATNDVSEGRDRDYVSGTSALIGTSKVIEKLKSASKNFWGDSRNTEETATS